MKFNRRIHWLFIHAIGLSHYVMDQTGTTTTDGTKTAERTPLSISKPIRVTNLVRKSRWSLILRRGLSAKPAGLFFFRVHSCIPQSQIPPDAHGSALISEPYTWT